jgi:hypothetical protein
MSGEKQIIQQGGCRTKIFRWGSVSKVHGTGRGLLRGGAVQLEREGAAALAPRTNKAPFGQFPSKSSADGLPFQFEIGIFKFR